MPESAEFGAWRLRKLGARAACANCGLATLPDSIPQGAVAGVVGIEGGVISGLCNGRMRVRTPTSSGSNQSSPRKSSVSALLAGSGVVWLVMA